MTEKYEFTGETIEYEGHTLRRIRALRCVRGAITGDLGGFIEITGNLSHEGTCWVGDNAKVFAEARVRGNALVAGEAVVKANARVLEHSSCYNRATVTGYSHLSGHARVLGDVVLLDNAHLTDKSKAKGHAVLRNYVTLTGYACVALHGRCGSDRDYLVIGPIGSRDEYTTFYRLEGDDIGVSCGCFAGSLEAFEEAVGQRHAEGRYRQDYLDAIRLARRRFGVDAKVVK